MPHYLYILRLGDGRLYVGETNNLARRADEHGHKPSSRTSFIHGADGIVYVEEHPNRSAALKREAQLKRWSGQKKQALIDGDGNRLRQLAKSREQG
jgi:putative endonuclease